MKQIVLWLLLLGSMPKPKTPFQEMFSDSFANSRLKHWNQVNGGWEVNREEKLVKGTKNSDWAILTAKKELPDNYVLTFSTLVATSSNLFEIMLNVQEEKYLGILYNQLESKVAIEDRSLFRNPEKEGSFIRTTGHIGKLPKVKIPIKEQWLDWKIQKSGNQFFVWINNEEIIKFMDSDKIVQNNGKFGFAVNGTAQLKKVTLYKIRKEIPMEEFVGKPYEKPFFLFSE